MKKPRRSFSLSHEAGQAIREHCEAAGVSMAGFVEQIVRERLGLPPITPKTFEVGRRAAKGHIARSQMRDERFEAAVSILTTSGGMF